MRSCIALSVLLLAVWSCTGTNQVYPIDQFSVETTDPYQPYHTIRAIVHYPKSNDAIQVPLIVFSPGFIASDLFYNYIPDALVPLGFVVAIVGSYDYDPVSLPIWKARDQTFLLGYLRNESLNNPQSPIYRKIGNESAAMGHSEGGVASLTSGDPQLLVYPYNNNWTSIVVLSGCFPPAYESNLEAAKYNKRPTLWITGTVDCICTDYRNLNFYSVAPSKCKYYIDLVNASHCLFAHENTEDEDLCFSLELSLGCGLDTVLPFSVQSQRVVEYIVPWFLWQLKGQVQYKQVVNSQLVADKASSLLQYSYSC